MPIINRSTEVNVPVRIAYDQWTQFEEFHTFMEDVKFVRRLDRRYVQWNVEVGGKTLEWDAEITEQVPDQKIAWRSTSDASTAGTVTFERVGGSRCRIHLQLCYRWHDADETMGCWVGVLCRRAARDLERFKQLIEMRAVEVPVH